MINVTNSVASLWEADARWLDAKLYEYDGSWSEIPNELQSFTVTKGAMADDTFELGSTFCPSASITMYGSYTPKSNRKVRIEIGVEDGNGTYDEEGTYTPNFSYIALGHFYIDSMDTNPYETTLTCTSEILGSMGSAVFDAETDVCSTILAQVGTQLGVSIGNPSGIGTEKLSKKIGSTDTKKTCREALAVLGKCQGLCVVEGLGTLSIRNPLLVDASNILKITNDRLESEFVSKGNIVFSSAEITVDDNRLYSFGTAPYNYSDESEFESTEAFAKFEANVKDKAYESGEISMLMGDPRIEPLDRIQIYHIDGEAEVVDHTVPVMCVEHRYDGALTTTVYAPTPSDYNNLVDSPNKKIASLINFRTQTESELAEYDTQLETIVNRVGAVENNKANSSLVKDDVAMGEMKWVADDNSLHIIGTNEDGDKTYETVVGGDGIKFKYNGETVASINQDNLVIDKTIVFTSMQVGDWLWEVHEGNLQLKWGGN